MFVLISLLMSLGWGTPLDSSNDEGYKLGAGDVVRVQVYGHPDMGREVTIPTRCSVELPFVGAVPVCGATTGEAAARIQERLADGYLVNPEVIIDLIILAAAVFKDVKRPGVRVLKGKTTLSEVVAAAERPSESNVFDRAVEGRQ